MALSDSARATARLAVDLARQANAIISFDINYRSKLWSPAEAVKHCEPILHVADLIFIPDRDVQNLFGLPALEDPEQALETLSGRYPTAKWIMTRGRTGSTCLAAGTFYVEGIFASTRSDVWVAAMPLAQVSWHSTLRAKAIFPTHCVGEPQYRRSSTVCPAICR